MTVITRFAPSPTGFLHIGGARTALFNWLFARHNDGKFLLRIEDTDKERSTQEAVDAILDSMKWLGLNWDDEEIYQSSRMARHRQVVENLVEQGKAYRCYCTAEELTAMREAAQAEKRRFRYAGKWRDAAADEQAPEGIAPSIRLRAPMTGEFTIEDAVQGTVTVKAEDQLDDMILLRSDGTPTYMLAVVVDDHDMGVTHIIRGDDHLTNSFRQQVIYNAMGWDIPTFSHIPLIHGADGAKLSKRHGALGAEMYREMGYLPEALTNYLLRLGWSHGDDEIISTQQAIEWFNTKGIGKGASRFDIAKLDNLNGHYIREAGDARLCDLVTPMLEQSLERELSTDEKTLLNTAMAGLKQRVKTLVELGKNAAFYFKGDSLDFDDKALKILNEDGGKELLSTLNPLLEAASDWSHDSLHLLCKEFGETQELKLGKVMGPIRAAICGTTASPSMFEVMQQLGKAESLARLNRVL